MTREEFMQGIRYLNGLYQKDMSGESTAVWYSMFKDDDADIFKEAIKRVGMKSQFYPSVAQIKDEMRTLNFPNLNAEDEWVKVVKAIQKFGFYNAAQALNSLEPITQKAVRNIGGFQRLCMSEEGDWDRKNFVSAFNELVRINKDFLILEPIKDGTFEKISQEAMKRLGQ